MKAAIEQMDNGAMMTIRKASTLNSQGEIVLKKVYTDFDSLVRDLRDNMQFRFQVAPGAQPSNGK